MEVLILLVFVSTLLAVGGVGLFVWSVRQGTHEHSDRLALFPLDDDESSHGTDPARGGTDASSGSPTDRSRHTQP